MAKWPSQTCRKHGNSFVANAPKERRRGGVLCKAVPVGAVHVTWLVIITVNEYNKQAKYKVGEQEGQSVATSTYLS